MRAGVRSLLTRRAGPSTTVAILQRPSSTQSDADVRTAHAPPAAYLVIEPSSDRFLLSLQLSSPRFAAAMTL